MANPSQSDSDERHHELEGYHKPPYSPNLPRRSLINQGTFEEMNGDPSQSRNPKWAGGEKEMVVFRSQHRRPTGTSAGLEGQIITSPFPTLRLLISRHCTVEERNENTLFSIESPNKLSFSTEINSPGGASKSVATGESQVELLFTRIISEGGRVEDPWKTLKKIHQRDEEKTKRNAAQALLRLHSSQEKGHYNDTNLDIEARLNNEERVKGRMRHNKRLELNYAPLKTSKKVKGIELKATNESGRP
ncbi:predicted protein [Sclerotinia sclerotiorum 1980 UF-70]|uniref:Uncharacterized protein n=1 Tax=Sclerotinia sclerotiorum (strain ATCC 18683 / 1980 / Ss-1) TaxID=665079 RepID=A7EDT0_SCLS1|nr:predicted protein [Sclerotinia sclerotiorum 1980 UF-70]EDO00996.1 predicted protein [Sclerotinia sclerotiorum 1980 UF-70]